MAMTYISFEFETVNLTWKGRFSRITQLFKEFWRGIPKASLFSTRNYSGIFRSAILTCRRRNHFSSNGLLLSVCNCETLTSGMQLCHHYYNFKLKTHYCFRFFRNNTNNKIWILQMISVVPLICKPLRSKRWFYSVPEKTSLCYLMLHPVSTAIGYCDTLLIAASPTGENWAKLHSKIYWLHSLQFETPLS